jgi:excisionase family DNA binding protein
MFNTNRTGDQQPDSDNSNPDNTAAGNLMTVREAAAFLRVSTPTIFRLRKSGKISFFKIGARVLFSRERLCEYLDRNEENTNTS